MHIAALKSIGDSCQKPLLYYKSNIGGTVSLLTVCSVSYYQCLKTTGLWYCEKKHFYKCCLSLWVCSITKEQIYPGKRAWPAEIC